MKANIFIISVFYMSSICFAQNAENKDSIQICYHIGSHGIGGQDHCITIYFDEDVMVCKRTCYSIFDNVHKYIDADADLSRYYEARKQAILRHYQENDNSIILDERIEISKSKFDELAKIINEIKAFVSAVDTNSDEIVITTRGICSYMIKDENGTTLIVDWLGQYNRSRDIEKVLGLTSYLRCPCLEKDLEQMGYNQKVPFWQRIFRRSPQ